MEPQKTVLCFGDSNTWGADPVNGGRHGHDVRWPGILRQALGTDVHVVEEGLSGRTTTFDDPVEGDKNGRKHLGMLLWSHYPLDLVIIMLGTNDLKARFHVPACDIAEAAVQLADMVRQNPVAPGWKGPKVLLVCPPPIRETGPFAAMFAGGEAVSKGFRQAFTAGAKNRNLDVLFVEDVASSHPSDGIHFDADAHRAIAGMILPKVRELLG